VWSKEGYECLEPYFGAILVPFEEKASGAKRESRRNGSTTGRGAGQILLVRRETRSGFDLLKENPKGGGT